MNILIISLRHDAHSLFVAYALAKLGHRVVIWAEPAVAGETTASIKFGAQEASLSTCGIDFFSDSIDVVWMRRHTRLSMPKWVVREDEVYVLQESNAFFRWLWGAIANNARWFHSLTGYLSSETKVLQMQAAQQAGLQVPETLFSNDPDKIRLFLKENEQFGGSIYKTFYPMGWDEPDYIKPVHTTAVTEGDFNDDDKIRAVSGIYQRKTDKVFEVRSTFFGARERSVKIDSQKSQNGGLDWRDIWPIDSYISEYSLPEVVNEKCLAYMRILGMDIACFDFIVTSSGEHVFLEANQQGQFLWVEQVLPSMPMLKEICCLLLGAVPETSAEWKVLGAVSLHEMTSDSTFLGMQSDLREFGYLDTGRFADAIWNF